MKRVLSLTFILCLSTQAWSSSCVYDSNYEIDQLNNEINKSSQTYKLYDAIDYCNEKKIKKAIDKGADLNGLNDLYNGQYGRYTPVVFAVKRRCPIAVKILRDNGANINLTRGTDSNSALMIAARRNDIESAQYLLEAKDIDVNQISGIGRTAIIVASLYGNKEIVELMLKHNDLDLSSASMFDASATAIGVAARQNNIETLTLLVNHSDEIKPITLHQLKGAFKKAQYNQHTVAIDLLESYRLRFYPDSNI